MSTSKRRARRAAIERRREPALPAGGFRGAPGAAKIRGVDYLGWLLVVSAAFALLERLFPWRRDQPMLRPGWLRDLLFLLWNGHLFGVLTAGASAALYGRVLDLMQYLGAEPERAPLATWPWGWRLLLFFVVSDLLQWCVHNLLHRVPFLWQFHKVHHSIPVLDWAGNLHFHWLESLVYRAAQAVPLSLLGADYLDAMLVFVAGTAWGHFNHANLNVGLGPLGYLCNSPRMHVWHHDISSEGGTAKNFGIVLSLWDWLFGTAYWPRDRSPQRIGYPGMAEMPQHFGGQMLWPLSARLDRRHAGRSDS